MPIWIDAATVTVRRARAGIEVGEGGKDSEKKKKLFLTKKIKQTRTGNE